MKYLLSIILLTLPVCALGQAQTEFIVKTQTGHFEVFGLRAAGFESRTLYGSVMNKTGHDWSIATFQMVLYDQAGRLIDENNSPGLRFSVYDLKDGHVGRIGATGNGDYISYSSNVQAARMELKFAGGTCPVNYSVALVKPVMSKEMKFEDELIAIQWAFSNKQLGFALQNKTDNPMKLDWNQVSFIDTDGTAGRVMHSGVKFISREESQPPTTIPPTAKIQDIVYPTANVYYDSGRYGGWREMPIFPNSEDALLLKGKAISVFMPLETNGKTKNYTFSIRIEDVKFVSSSPIGANNADKQTIATPSPFASQSKRDSTVYWVTNSVFYHLNESCPRNTPKGSAVAASVVKGFGAHLCSVCARASEGSSSSDKTQSPSQSSTPKTCYEAGRTVPCPN